VESFTFYLWGFEGITLRARITNPRYRCGGKSARSGLFLFFCKSILGQDRGLTNLCGHRLQIRAIGDHKSALLLNLPIDFHVIVSRFPITL